MTRPPFLCKLATEQLEVPYRSLQISDVLVYTISTLAASTRPAPLAAFAAPCPAACAPRAPVRAAPAAASVTYENHTEFGGGSAPKKKTHKNKQSLCKHVFYLTATERGGSVSYALPA